MIKLAYFIVCILTFNYAYCSQDGNTLLMIITNNSNQDLTYAVTDYDFFDTRQDFTTGPPFGNFNDYGQDIKFTRDVIKNKTQASFNPYTLKPMTLGTIYPFGASKFIIPPRAKLSLIGKVDRGQKGWFGGITATISLTISLLPVTSNINIYRKVEGDWNATVDNSNPYDFDTFTNYSNDVNSLVVNVDSDNEVSFYSMADGMQYIASAPLDSANQGGDQATPDPTPVLCVPRDINMSVLPVY